MTGAWKYASELADAQWQILKPFFSKRFRYGWPITYDRRTDVGAILYLNRIDGPPMNISVDQPPTTTWTCLLSPPPGDWQVYHLRRIPCQYFSYAAEEKELKVPEVGCSVKSFAWLDSSDATLLRISCSRRKCG